LILAVDTSSACASFAIARGTEVIASIESDASMPHSKVFFDLLTSLLQRANLSLAEIGVFAAAAGPGSFTGLRVGLSAIKGISHARGKPAIGVNSLDAVALTAKTPGKVLALIDAGRAEVYAGLRDVCVDGTFQLCGTDCVGQLSAIIESVGQHLGAEALTVASVGSQEIAPAYLPINWRMATAATTTAEEIAIYAGRMVTGQFNNGLHAHYIRPSDAEIKRAN